MATKSKFFRVATEGATTDGRKIEKNWIIQMAKNFDQLKYGARIWLEHIRGVLPDSQFRAYGDVLALKTEEVTVDGEKKLALFAQISPTDDLIAMNKKRQKIYTSIEIDDKFADTGEAYLVGLGVTDSPASLGTEVLSFASQNPEANPYAARKQKADNLFSACIETEIEFEEEETSTSFSETIKGILAKFSKATNNNDDRFSEVVAGMEKITEEIVKAHATFASADSLTKVQTNLETLQTSYKELVAKLHSTPGNQPARPTASGQDGIQTDC